MCVCAFFNAGSVHRYRQKLALLEAKDPAEFSRRCVADPTLCRSLLRVYILGGGVCTSLERVGKQVIVVVLVLFLSAQC